MLSQPKFVKKAAQFTKSLGLIDQFRSVTSGSKHGRREKSTGGDTGKVEGHYVCYQGQTLEQHQLASSTLPADGVALK